MSTADKVLDKTETLVTAIADKAGNIFDAAATLIGKGIEQYGPQAVDAVLWTVRINAIQSLLWGWVLTIAVLFLFWYVHKKAIWPLSEEIKKRKEVGESTYKLEADQSFIIPVTWGITVPAIVLFSLVTLNVWNYVAIVKPELYLVKKTVDAVEKKLSK